MMRSLMCRFFRFSNNHEPNPMQRQIGYAVSELLNCASSKRRIFDNA